jgi:hypothetical protein
MYFSTGFMLPVTRGSVAAGFDRKLWQEILKIRTVQYLDSKKQTGADETGNVRGAGYALRGA